MTEHTALVAAAPALPADRQPVAVYLAGLAAGSRRALRDALDRVARELGGVDATTVDWTAIEYQHVAAVRSRLVDVLAPATVNRHLAAVRGVVREAWRLGLVSAEKLKQIEAVHGVVNGRLPAGRALSARERTSLYEGCAADASPAGRRDAALLALLDGAGLRRAEAVGLELVDVEGDTDALLVRHGKGGKQRRVAIGNGTREAVRAWLDVRGSEPGALLCPVRKGGTVEVRPMTAQAAYAALSRRCEAAGLEGVTPHDFRRTLISDMLDDGVDISTVSKIVGHSAITTTARYDRRDEHAGRRAINGRPVPYVRPAKG